MQINFLAWFELITRLGVAVASQQGKAPRELAYLQIATRLAALTSATDADLTALKAKYEAEAAADAPTTVAELQAIIDRIEARGVRIQNA